MRYSTTCKRIFFQTYAVLLGLSLANFSLLGGLALPFLAGYYFRFTGFLLYPVCFAMLAALATAFCLTRFFPKTSRIIPLIANVIFLTAFIPAANAYKNHLIDQQLASHTPECVGYGSFFDSAFKDNLNFRGHAIFEENGKVYLWSYSQVNFFEANPRLAKNFSCQK